jgi:aryl-alcohol dehydrogenase-like predicted oxidoreductase
MTQLGLGCVGLGSGSNRRAIDDVRLVQAAIDLGVVVFDTADVYGSGASEHVLGRAVRRRRDEVVIATKGGYVFRERRPVEQWVRRHGKRVVGARRSRRRGSGLSGSGPYSQQDFTARYLREAVHASLRRLRTDRIDVYQLHAPETVLPDLFDQLADLVTAGDVARFGVGVGSVPAADGWLGAEGLDVVQVPFGVLDPEAAATTLPLARRHRCEVWVRGVLGGGLLGLADRDPAAVADDPKRPLIEALTCIAKESGLDWTRLAIGFVQAHAHDIATVLVGTTSVAHLRAGLDALEAPPLPTDVRRALSDLSASTVGNP